MALVLRRRSYGLTDVGRKRPHNEDSFVADDTLGLYLVADGVGGHAKGEVASSESAEQVRNFVCSAWAEIDGQLRTESERLARVAEEAQAALEAGIIDDAAGLEAAEAGAEAGAEANLGRVGLRRLLESAVQSACYHVYGIAEQDPSGAGMSTTLSALLVAGDQAVVAQVGDSRVYRLRAGEATQLTIDHTLLNHQLRSGLITEEQAASSRGKNVITRAVGHRDYVQVDTFSFDLHSGDRFLICSDGLHNYLRPGEVESLLVESQSESAVRRAIDLANDRGGRDNITAIVVQIRA